MRSLLAFFLFLSLGARCQKVIEKYPNGQVMSEINYKDSLKDGASKFYHENGKLAAIIEFKKGETTGTIYEFRDDGSKYAEISAKDLNAKVYSKDGLSYEKGTYENTEFVKNGTWEEWEGKPVHKRFSWTYLNDVKNGPYKAYRKDGSVEAEGHYHNGTIADTLKLYDEKGHLLQMEIWKAEEDGASSKLVNTIYLTDVKADGTTEVIDGKLYIWTNGKKKFIDTIAEPDKSG